MWRRLRIIALRLILLVVAVDTWLDRIYTTDWNLPLRVAVFPIDADRSGAAEQFVRRLQVSDFERVERFFSDAARSHGVSLEQPFRLVLAPPLDEPPPALAQNAGALGAMIWTLRMRWWAWRVPPELPGPRPDIRLFVLYHDPARSSSIPHSVGLQKGLFGVVHLFADRSMSGSNDVVLAHELLHTVGATDKYDPRSNQPIYPEGFAEPQREPRYPQTAAELMGGRIPVSASEAEIPVSLREVRVGNKTAEEIGWLGADD
jgi:hypothetical protein